MYTINWNTDIEKAEGTLPYYLNKSGYSTGYVGKFHSGINEHVLGAKEFDANLSPYDERIDRIRKANQNIFVKEMNRLTFVAGRHKPGPVANNIACRTTVKTPRPRPAGWVRPLLCI